MKFVTDPLCAEHLRGVAHPERPERVEGVVKRLRARGVLDETLRARDVTDVELERVHTPGYLRLVERETAHGREARYLSTGDTVIDGESYGAARRAAGGAVVAVEASAAKREAVFALVRPPGHHAEPDRGMGFCLFNNVAVAARAYQAATPGARVLIADFDYHHGNGTEAIAGDGISYLSTHAYPAYPGTGRSSSRRGQDLVINVPLPAGGIETEAFVAIWQTLLPAIAGFIRPDIMIVSAGFDYVEGDSVGDLGVAVAAAGPIGSVIRGVAEEHCSGSVAYVLEGGYGIEAIAQSIELVALAHDASTRGAGADSTAIPKEVRRSIEAALSLLQGSPPRD